MDWAEEKAKELLNGKMFGLVHLREIAEALRSARELGERVEVEFKDIEPPGLFKTVQVMGMIGYSGPPEKPAVHVSIMCSDEDMKAAHPAVEALMLAWAKECGEGVERGLDLLRENALHQMMTQR